MTTKTDIDELLAFAKNVKPAWRSPCWDFKDEIDKLLELGVTHVKILEWLSLPPRNLILTSSDISTWLIRRRKRAEKARIQKQAGIRNPDETEQPATAVQHPSPSVRPTAPITRVAPTSSSKTTQPVKHKFNRVDRSDRKDPNVKSDVGLLIEEALRQNEQEQLERYDSGRRSVIKPGNTTL